MHRGSVVLGRGAARGEIQRHGVFESAGLLKQISAKVQPPRIRWPKDRRVAIARVGRVEEFVGMKDTTEAAVRVGEIAGRRFGRRLLEGRTRAAKVISNRSFERVQLRKC